MKNLLFIALALISFSAKPQSRDMYHSVDVTAGFSMPMGIYKNGFIENLTGGNATAGLAGNISIHVEVKEFFGVVFKYGYQRNGVGSQAVKDFFGGSGDVAMYGRDSWRLSHLGLGGQVITPVGNSMNADFYALIGLEWGYVPNFEMVYEENNTKIHNYYNFSPFVAPAGIIGGDFRIRLTQVLSFVANAEFMFCQPAIDYIQIISATNSAEVTRHLTIQSVNLSGGVPIGF
jgi:hypothetical protein